MRTAPGISLWIERTLWVVGISLVSTYGGMRLWAEESRAQAVEEYRAIHLAQAAAAAESRAVTDQSLWSKKRIDAYEQAQREGVAPQGLLRIPKLALEVPVYADTSDINLDRGAGHIPGTATLDERGNVGLAAHRDGFFRKLKDVELGMDIFVEHGGRTLRYQITEISIVSPEEKAVLGPTERPSVTLVTCYPFYFIGNAPQRFIVRAELDETQKLNHVVINRNLQRRDT